MGSEMATLSTKTLKQAGLRVTPQRRAILDVLEAADRPLSVEDVRSRMTEHPSGVPTLYRNLDHFVKLGWVESLLGADQVMRFVRCRCRKHHHHLQCERCGKTVEIENCPLDARVAEGTGFTLTRHQLFLFGLCEACGGQAEPKRKG